MKTPETVDRWEDRPRHGEYGFSLIELMIAAAVLVIVLGGAVQYISVAAQRSKVEQTKVDLSQEGREFVDEFERDIHQAGYPSCFMFNNAAACAAANPNTAAMGLVFVSNTQIVFEGDVDGDGVVDSVSYQVVDSAGNTPPTGTCPCTIQRSQVPKGTPANFSLELQNVVNSGAPTPAQIAGGQLYGNGLPIAGNVLFGGGVVTNTAYYAAVVSFKDFPVFSAYDQNGASLPLVPQLTYPANAATLANIKTIRLTINLLGSGASGYDPKTGVRPVVTLVGNGRVNNDKT
jgi:prepilin-type N-terminal cleavage/methylation domain-containing protein